MILSEIDWAGSFLLGWKIDPGNVALCLEVATFCRETRKQNYDLAVLRFIEVTKVSGFPEMVRRPAWQVDDGDYKEVAEIDEFRHVDSSIDIDADLLTLHLEFGEACLELLEERDASDFDFVFET